ncbi:MAG: nucleotidyltransferase domain-containing protein [Anaerolineaceae bacterium]|nr:nucleotidyltransferase domain-containing protein [Anaerolineaceae bacterium]
MIDDNKPIEKMISDLKERAKELNCLYEVQELLSTPEITIDEIWARLIEILPAFWQFPEYCTAKIIYGNSVYQSPDFKETPWVQSADILVQDQREGIISIYYTTDVLFEDEDPFLKEELKLINTIAEQVGNHILHKRLKEIFEERNGSREEQKSEWWVILDLLKRTDPALLTRVSRKMVNYLGGNGVKEAEYLLEHFAPVHSEGRNVLGEANYPYESQPGRNILEASDNVFNIAEKHLSNNEILNNIQNWIQEDRSHFLINILVKPGSSLSEIRSAIERYRHLALQGLSLSALREKWLRISLIRRILSDQPAFVKNAKKFVDVADFFDLLKRVIHLEGSHGKLGGKGSGVFLAELILKKTLREEALLKNIKTPKTWYITSDSIFYFLSDNNLEDILEQKYKDIGQVRQEYPYIVHLLKNSPASSEIINGLSLALDDFGDVPLIVRSSSLLEDRAESVFAGKYKSLFVANQGTKKERLNALTDAIAEVYASIFGPDPIEYRYGRDLLDYHEEMGIMIQEVVGTRIGPYFAPAFAGVAFSNNEFRWSSRINREDGLIRMVPGLGTRAVDRLTDDYPVLIAPGQPRLRANVTVDEIARYSPRKMDVINLNTNMFETIDVHTLIKEYGREYPNINKIVSILKFDHIQAPSTLGIDFEKNNFVITFEGLVSRSPFISQMKAIMSVLQEALDFPVDIEFASDGTDFYLLQCRAQSFGEDSQPASIPRNIPQEKIIFSANRYVSNGFVPDITHIVYIDAQNYSELSTREEMLTVGRVVGRLNKILPQRQFILMGPGRWGSRGDIKLGVSVTYSDINNTAVLIEIARKQKDYVPDLSFGTHFFQDLVEASIRYLPLYPDDYGNKFNEEFLKNSKNILSDILPDFSSLSDVIHVIDISGSTNGKILQVLMNADIDEAVAILSEPTESMQLEKMKSESNVIYNTSDIHWRWRQSNAESIAAKLEPERFGVQGFYLFGSTQNATARPESDIDLLIHINGSESQRKELLNWLDGWSQSLSQTNYMRTGYKTEGLLDVHLVTDEDIENRTSYAVKIGAISDAARPLPMGLDL